MDNLSWLASAETTGRIKMNESRQGSTIIMQRKAYIDYITKQLTQFSLLVENQSAVNLNDSALLSEGFYREFCNILFKLDLKSSNINSSTTEGIDLIDSTHQKFVQVTAQNRKDKVQHTLDELKDKKYANFSLFILVITPKSIKHIRNLKYATPTGVTFTPKTNILDIKALLRYCQAATLVQLSELESLCRREFHDEPVIHKPSAIATVVQIILGDKFDFTVNIKRPLPFNLQDKVDYNHLQTIQSSLIDPLKIYFPEMDKIYQTFNVQGHFLLKLYQRLAYIYEQVSTRFPNGSNAEIMIEMVDVLTEIVNNSSNLDEPIDPDDCLLSCRIILVHAFMDCKIFEDPEGYYDTAN